MFGEYSTKIKGLNLMISKKPIMSGEKWPDIVGETLYSEDFFFKKYIF